MFVVSYDQPGTVYSGDLAWYTDKEHAKSIAKLMKKQFPNFKFTVHYDSDHLVNPTFDKVLELFAGE